MTTFILIINSKFCLSVCWSVMLCSCLCVCLPSYRAVCLSVCLDLPNSGNTCSLSRYDTFWNQDDPRTEQTDPMFGAGRGGTTQL